MSTQKQASTRLHGSKDLCTRVSNEPLLTPLDVSPSDPRLEVIGVLNPTFINIGASRHLIVRVDERPLGFRSREISENKILIARADLEDNGRISVFEVEVPSTYDPNKEPILPTSVCNTAGRPSLLLSYISHLRIVDLVDCHARVREKPIAFPDHPFTQYGYEDPRATLLEGQAIVTYTAVSKHGATAWLAKLSDTCTFEMKIMLLGPDHKHTVLFPNKFRNGYYMLSRPLSRTYIHTIGAWLFQSPDLVHWGNSSPLILPRPDMWDSNRVGPSTSPVLTERGWLIFYYGVDKDDSYHAGAVLLDEYNPMIILGRSATPILSPILDWEREGRRADTVFPCGIEFLDNHNIIRLYYGAGDVCIGVADISMAELLASLK